MEILHNHTGVTGGMSCARSWLYEAVLAPMAVRLKTEIAKVPALEFLVNPGGGQVESAVTVWTALFTRSTHGRVACLCVHNS